MTAVDNAYKFVIKGISKYASKVETMKKHYAAAKDRAIAEYKACGFNDEIVADYTNAWNYMPENYSSVMDAKKALKWCFDWIVKMYSESVAREVATRLKTQGVNILSKVGLTTADVDEALNAALGVTA